MSTEEQEKMIMGVGNCGFPGSEIVCVSLAAILVPNLLLRF